MGRIEVFLTPHGAGLTDTARPGEVCFCRVISKPNMSFFWPRRTALRQREFDPLCGVKRDTA
jgi:hypothetical protein